CAAVGLKVIAAVVWSSKTSLNVPAVAVSTSFWTSFTAGPSTLGPPLTTVLTDAFAPKRFWSSKKSWPTANGFPPDAAGSLNELTLSLSWTWRMSVWSASTTSRLGLVWSSTYLLVPSGTSALPGAGNGLNHSWLRVSVHVPLPLSVPPVMIRTLFLPGPWVFWLEPFWS